MGKRCFMRCNVGRKLDNRQQLAFQVLLEEYKSCRAEILQRIQMCHQFSLSGYLVLGAIFAFIFHQGFENNNELRSIVLLFPLPLFFLGLSFQHTTRNVYLNARYINLTIRSELVKMSGNEKILGWEEFLAKAKPDGSFFRLKDEEILYMISPMVLLMLILLIKVKACTPLDNFFVFLNVTTFVLSVLSHRYTSKKYAEIEKQYN